LDLSAINAQLEEEDLDTPTAFEQFCRKKAPSPQKGLSPARPSPEKAQKVVIRNQPVQDYLEQYTRVRSPSER